MDQPKSFLEKLQSSDEVTKQRWLVGSAAIIMTIVVFLWLAYFNSFVIGPRSGVPVEPGPAAEGSSATFLGTMKNGASVLYDGFWGKLRALGDILEKPREYIIKPPQ
ncbi:MAG: hypothetical protein A2945_01885 [Candidatus Liptonbacteria bacterium RIFCSPLOWO2_01_FULL_52_25]|uniref:Uncharacterized protein n=1 Tax=Candidatus Liptonbacteria bacterium RIFCSPLOWO2_01_FULL_52_25 TaxID=1798650 RepID=A0A1G2CGF3_9BACT|nr:MAG: hypothetical protein A2945_01885 [Candidatus Liptonbacteria bacterium RIFCSPLOWO2_01_FULL_52_25]